MKGLKIELAKPSNSVDIYAMLKKAQEEGVLVGKPNPKQLEDYYFFALLNQLSDPLHKFFLAKRGRGYLGFAHAYLIRGPWGGDFTMFVDKVYVLDQRRKQGVGRKLLDEIVKQAQNIRIKRVEFLCPVQQTEYWAKERGAKTTLSFMGVDV